MKNVETRKKIMFYIFYATLTKINFDFLILLPLPEKKKANNSSKFMDN